MSSKKSKARKVEESDDDAPEAVSNTAAKSNVLEEKHKQRLNKLQIEEEKKQKKVASTKSTPEKSVEVEVSKEPSSSKKKEKAKESETPKKDTPKGKSDNSAKVKTSTPATSKTPKEKEAPKAEGSNKKGNKQEKTNERSDKNLNESDKAKEVNKEATSSAKKSEKKAQPKPQDADAMEVDEEANPSINNDSKNKKKNKKEKKLAPLPMEVLQKLVEDQSMKNQVEASASKKRSREEREAQIEDPMEEGSDLDEAALDDIRLPSDDLEEGADGVEGEPAAKKPKTYGFDPTFSLLFCSNLRCCPFCDPVFSFSSSMFNVVALDALKDGNEIDAKVKQFLRGHFWGDRIPRSDPNKYFSERIQYGRFVEVEAVLQTLAPSYFAKGVFLSEIGFEIRNRNMLAQMQMQNQGEDAPEPQTWWTAVGDDPDFEFVQNALKNGQDVNERCPDEEAHKMTALHLAVGHDHEAIVEELIKAKAMKDKAKIQTNNEVIVEELIKAKADVHATDAMGFTALHHAAMSGAIDSAKLLLKAGANVNADSVRQTPLHLASKIDQGGVALAALLLSKGASLSTDPKRTQPLELALESGNTAVAALLIYKGAKRTKGANEDDEAEESIAEQFEQASELAQILSSPESFDSVDLDKDGFIEISDLETSGAPMEAITELFPFADLNGDGKLDRDEYAVFNLILSELMAGIDTQVDDAFGGFDMNDIMESLANGEGGENPFIQFGGGGMGMGMGGMPFMGRQGGQVFFGGDEDDDDEDGEEEDREDGPLIEEVGDDDEVD